MVELASITERQIGSLRAALEVMNSPDEVDE